VRRRPPLPRTRITPRAVSVDRTLRRSSIHRMAEIAVDLSRIARQLRSPVLLLTGYTRWICRSVQKRHLPSSARSPNTGTSCHLSDTPNETPSASQGHRAGPLAAGSGIASTAGNRPGHTAMKPKIHQDLRSVGSSACRPAWDEQWSWEPPQVASHVIIPRRLRRRRRTMLCPGLQRRAAWSGDSLIRRPWQPRFTAGGGLVCQ
jgi:hypothetical protein